MSNESAPEMHHESQERPAEDVRIDIAPNGGGKYVLCKVVKTDGSEAFVLRGNSTDTQHFQIVEKIEEEYKGATVTVLGGGFITYYGPEIGNEMALHDKSFKYGREDREITKKLLAEAYPDRTIIEEDDTGSS